MRTLQLSLAGTITMVLLGGLGGVVLAQDEPADPMAPAVVTGTATGGPETAAGTTTFDAGVYRTEGVQFVNTWEASDPRLSGESTYTGNWQGYPVNGFQVEAATRVLVNDAGRWVGPTTALASATMNTDTVILHGEGAYEGLTAYLLMDWTTDPATFVGAIFPGDMPAYPEPPAD